VALIHSSWQLALVAALLASVDVLRAPADREFVRRVQARRGTVPVERLVEMRIHGVEP